MIPVWFLFSPALAADITVDPTGAPATIQAAIDLAQDGDVIVVPTGTHIGCFDLGGRDLGIRGAGAATTTLDGAGCAELVRARGGESLDLEALRLTNEGGRCVGVLGGSLTLRSVLVATCGSPDIDGAGVWARSANTLVEDTEFRDNIGDEGAALLSWDGGTLAIRDSHFEGNLASEQGAAIYGNGDIAGTIEDTDFIGNASPERVAGAVAWHRGTLQITRARFEDNAANLYGGALYAHHVGDGVVLEDVLFTGNTATGGDGGAIALAFDAVLQLQGVTLTGNQARDGGAIWVSGGSITATDSRFEGNTATARGGAIAATTGAALVTVGVGFCDHDASQGGTLHLDGGRHRLEQTWVARTAASEAGGAVLADTAALAMGWVSIVRSDAPRGAAVDVAGGSLDLHSSLLGFTSGGAALAVRDGALSTGGANAWWANEGGDAGEDAEAPTAEDVQQSPALLGWTGAEACDALDLRLQRDSPLVDRGRPDAVDPDSSRADVGAWGGPAARWTDEDGDGDAYPVDCDDTDAAIGPDCTERDAGGDTADTGSSPAPDAGEVKGRGDPAAGDCGGSAAGALGLLLLGLRRRRA